MKTGSTAATWVSETGARTASQLTFDQLVLTPYELATYTEVSKQLLEDNAYNLQGELTADLSESFAIAEAQAFIAGDGTGKPLGLLSATTITEVKTGNASTLGAAPADMLITLMYQLPAAYRANGIWVMNGTTLAAVRKLKDGQGNFLWQPSFQAGQPETILGRPVVEMVDMPDVAANAVPIMFGDFQGYRIVDRVGLEILSDPYTGATTGLHKFHARRRVGGGLTHPERFRKLKVAV